MISDLIAEFNDVLELVSANIHPVTAQIKSKIGMNEIDSGILKDFIVKAGEQPGTVGDAMDVVTSMMIGIETECQSIIKFLEKTGDLSERQVEYLGELVKDLNGCVMFTSDMLMSIFIDRRAAPSGKIQQQIQGLNGFVSMYTSMKDSEVVSDIKGIPSDVPSGMVANVLPKSSPLIALGFTGNPFYTIGKIFKRRSNKRVEAMKARCKYIELELLELEMGEGKNSATQKKYYLKLVKELEAEIALSEKKAN